MNHVRLDAVLSEALQALQEQNIGPGQRMPIKALLLQLVKSNIRPAEVAATLELAEREGWINRHEGGPADMGVLELTAAGYARVVRS